MEDVFKESVQQAKYLMVDETTELIGVETPEGKAYRRKYLWAFFAKHVKLVYYHYNNGSRASDGNHTIFRLDAHYSQTYLCAITKDSIIKVEINR